MIPMILSVLIGLGATLQADNQPAPSDLVTTCPTRYLYGRPVGCASYCKGTICSPPVMLPGGTVYPERRWRTDLTKVCMCL